MADDEEVYFENNQIHQYLCSCDEFSGCYDVIKLQRKENIDVVPISRPTLSVLHYQLDNGTLSLQICKILECGLMLEEDANYIGNIADPYNLCSPRQHLFSGGFRSKLFFVGSACLMSMLFCTTSRHLSVTFSMATVSYAVWEYYKLIQQRRQVRAIDDLLTLLHQFFQVLKKSTQLIQENEILSRGNILARSAGIDFSSLPSHIAKWQLMVSLRSAISSTVHQTVVVLSNGTRQLIRAVPLAGQLNLNQCYLATLDEGPLTLLKTTDDLPLSSLKHNHSIYLLLQSEFLRQLALCCCPKMWLCNTPQQLQDIDSITTTVMSEISQLTTNLKGEYQTFYSYGLNDKKIAKSPQPSWKYCDVYVAAHSAVLHLQAMLLKSRAIEELLEKNGQENQSENFLGNVETIFEDVLRENDSFESCCKEGIAQIRKLKIIKTQNDKSRLVTPELENSVDQEHFIEPEDYVVEDEVFEAISFENELSREENRDTVVLTKEERVQREIERQLSRRMVKELKTVLVSKSTEWKERERRALLKKAGLDPSILEEASPLTELPCNDGEWPLPRLKTGLPKKYPSSCSTRRRSSIDFDCSHTLDESDLAGNTTVFPSTPYLHPRPTLPPPPPPPPPSNNTLPEHATLDRKGEGEGNGAPLALRETIFKGAEHFWSIRNQLVEDTFSGSGENLHEFGDITKDEDTTQTT